MGSVQIYPDEVIIDVLLERLLTDANIDDCDTAAMVGACLVLKELQLVKGGAIKTERKNKTVTNYYMATDELKELLIELGKL